MDTDLISVVIPVYNVENYINKCLDSVIKSKYKNLQIICVNDGSTDGSLELLKNYKSKDTRVEVYSKTNGGLSDARNYGIKYAKGKYITFIDSDDYVTDDYFESLYNNLIKEDADISICGNYRDELGNIKTANLNNVYEVLNSKDALKTLLLYDKIKHFWVSSWGKLYKTSLFEGMEFPVGKKSEDWFLIPQLFLKSNKIIYDSNPKYYYVFREGSITQTNSKPNTDSIEATDFVLELVKKVYPDLVDEALSSCVCNKLGIATAYLYLPNSKDKVKYYKKATKTQYKLIKNKSVFKKQRRIQLKIFFMSNFIYKIIYKILR